MSHTLEELEAMRQQAQAMLDRAEASHQALLAAVRNLDVNTEEVQAYWRSVGPLSAEDEAGLAPGRADRRRIWRRTGGSSRRPAR